MGTQKLTVCSLLKEANSISDSLRTNTYSLASKAEEITANSIMLSPRRIRMDILSYTDFKLNI